MVSTSRFGQVVFFNSTQASRKNCAGSVGLREAMVCARRCACASGLFPVGTAFLGPVGSGVGLSLLFAIEVTFTAVPDGRRQKNEQGSRPCSGICRVVLHIRGAFVKRGRELFWIAPHLPRAVPLFLMLRFILVGLDMDDRVQVVQGVAKLVFQLFREPVGLDKRMRVGNLNMDIQVAV